MQSKYYSSNRNKRRERLLQKMDKFRAAKERKRAERCVPTEYFDKYPLEIGVRNKRTGETAWVDFKSVRDAAKRLSVIQKHYL